MNAKIDVNSGSLDVFKSSHDQHQKDIVTLFSKVSSIKMYLSNEFSISGHLGALNLNTNLSDIVVGVVNHMGPYNFQTYEKYSPYKEQSTK